MANHILSDYGRERAESFVSGLAGYYKVKDASKTFSCDPQRFTVAEPAKAQEIKVQLEQTANAFLALVDVSPMPQMTGEVIYMGMGGITVSRTNTKLAGHERTPKSAHSLKPNEYSMKSVENDVKIDYSEIDKWAFDPNFQLKWADKRRQAIDNDRLRVGWNGESAELETNYTNNPNGEDVLPGWLELIRVADNGDHYIDGSGGAVKLGSAEYPTLDYLVEVAKQQVDPVYQNSPELVAIISQNLVNHEVAQFRKRHGRKPSEKMILDATGKLAITFGGLEAFIPPFLGDGVVLVTTLKNLIIYYQLSSLRRKIEDKPEINAYADWNSRNECFAIGDYRATSLVDGITIDEELALVEEEVQP